MEIYASLFLIDRGFITMLSQFSHRIIHFFFSAAGLSLNTNAELMLLPMSIVQQNLAKQITLMQHLCDFCLWLSQGKSTYFVNFAESLIRRCLHQLDRDRAFLISQLHVLHQSISDWQHALRQTTDLSRVESFIVRIDQAQAQLEHLMTWITEIDVTMNQLGRSFEVAVTPALVNISVVRQS